MNTPVKAKRARQIQQGQGTPIPMNRENESTFPVACIYNPPVSRLKMNYEQEFIRFLKSAKAVMDYMEKSDRDKLFPMRKQLRRLHKESNNLDIYFKSQAYWKYFYRGLINHCDDIMDCFRFDDLRDVATVVQSHNLPDELVSFVTQQLLEWRELFKDVEWMKQFRDLSKTVENLKDERQEYGLRLDIVREIGKEIDMCGLNVLDLKKNNPDFEQFSNSIVSAILEAKKSQSTGVQLKNVPMVSKRMSVRRWCRKHYDPLAQSVSDNESDDESLSDDDNSSLFVGTADSSVRDADSSCRDADLSSDEADADNDFESFFGAGHV